MNELKLVVGLMSGTSLDGVDAALVEILGSGLMTRVRLKHYVSIPFAPDVSEELLRVASGRPVSAGKVSQLNFLLGNIYSEAVSRLCKEAGVATPQLDLIGTHGQTIYHQSEPTPFCGHRISSTLQIGEASILAERTGVTTVSDFRPRDMAAGGKGAPLIPYVDFLLFRDQRQGRILLNIGGIANITSVPASAKIEEIKAFDTGPGNMVIDAVVQHFTQGKKHYDHRGKIGSSGRIIPDLLKSLLADPYFNRRPPKTAGREQFGGAFLSRILSQSKTASFENLVCTVTELTACTVARSIRDFVAAHTHCEQLIVSGGGARNDFLMKRIAALVPRLRILRTDDLGIPACAKEAIGFAILANETIHLHSGNVPSATGARHPVVLGKVVFGKNYKALHK